MKMRRIVVLGGSGFIGQRIVSQLAAQGYQVTVPTRHRERAKRSLILLPTVEVIEADIHDAHTLNNLFRAKDVVINLVGVLQGSPAYFKRVHVDLPQKVVAACQRNEIKRLLHMSALNADPAGPSYYLRTKGEGEAIVRASGLDTTVVRPSVVFGEGDRFLNVFARLLKVFPILPLACPSARFQPIYVEDVARVFNRSLGQFDTYGGVFNLCGSKVYSLRELVGAVGEITGHIRPIIGLGPKLSYLQALLLEKLPGKLMSRDNLASMKLDNVCQSEFPSIFGVTPAALEAVLPYYLTAKTPRARYTVFRARARRNGE